MPLSVYHISHQNTSVRVLLTELVNTLLTVKLPVPPMWYFFTPQSTTVFIPKPIEEVFKFYYVKLIQELQSVQTGQPSETEASLMYMCRQIVSKNRILRVVRQSRVSPADSGQFKKTSRTALKEEFNRFIFWKTQSTNEQIKEGRDHHEAFGLFA